MNYNALAERRGDKTFILGISAKNFWQTPQNVFDALDAEFHFDLDAAADSGSAKCPEWLGLDHPDPQRRNARDLTRWPGTRFFLNPPYSPDGGTLFKWCARTVMEMVDNPSAELAVMLLPGTMDTEWAEFLAEEEVVDEIRFTPRINFIDPISMRSNPMGGSIVVVFRRTPILRDVVNNVPRFTVGYAPWKKR